MSKALQEECQPDRSDGSDSGLGSDLSDDRLGTMKSDSLSSDELNTPSCDESNAPVDDVTGPTPAVYIGPGDGLIIPSTSLSDVTVWEGLLPTEGLTESVDMLGLPNHVQNDGDAPVGVASHDAASCSYGLESSKQVAELSCSSRLSLLSDQTDSLRSVGAPRSMLKRRVEDEISAPPIKKLKKSIAFGEVDVFYFPRAQGFTCVPSQVRNIDVFLLVT